MTLGTNPDAAPLTPCDLGKNLDDACHDVEAEIARTDSKASLLLVFTGAVRAGLASLAGKDLPLPAQPVGGAAKFQRLASVVDLILAAATAVTARRTSRPDTHKEQ